MSRRDRGCRSGRRRRRWRGRRGLSFRCTSFFSGLEIFFGGIGAGAVEKDVALGANGFDGHAVVGEDAIEPARAATVDGVIGEIAFGFGKRVEANHFFELREVWRARVEPLEVVRHFLEGSFVIGQRSGAFFDVFRNFRKSRAAIGA